MRFPIVVFFLALGCAKPRAVSLAPAATAEADASPSVEAPAAVVPSIEQLQQWLVGRFDSSAQAMADERYFDVSLTVCPVTWHGAEKTLYVEQAITANLAKPYRQRLYVLSRDGELFRSQIYELSDAESAVGLCAAPENFDADSEATVLDGCAVELNWTGDAFEGTTSGRACTNAWGDAAYATSEVRIHADGVLSWDRGYDDAGSQVWGAEAGPYAFVRVNDPAGTESSR